MINIVVSNSIIYQCKVCKLIFINNKECPYCKSKNVIEVTEFVNEVVEKY